MGKNIIKIVAFAAAICTVTAFAPVSSGYDGKTVGLTAAYASDNDVYLEDIEVETTSGREVKLYKRSSCTSSSRYDSDDDDEVPDKLYAKVSSSVSRINITYLDLPSDCEIEKIKKGSKTYFDNDDDDQEDYDQEDISLSHGENEIKITIVNEDGDDENYYLNITRGDEDDDDEYDNVYLDDLSLRYNYDDVEFNFDRYKTSFDISVDNDVDYVRVTAEPEDEDYEDVWVDGSRVDDDDDFESDKIYLKEGLNTIRVRIENDDDDEREYTLNITRKVQDSVDNNVVPPTDVITENTGWTLNLGKYYYRASNGAMLTNTWFYDRDTGNSYYFGATGEMATGWLNLNNKWYLLDWTGYKKTGWQYSGNAWYYLDSSGVMLTGWFKDLDGKYYYLDETSGAMWANTNVGPYKLGPSGACINL